MFVKGVTSLPMDPAYCVQGMTFDRIAELEKEIIEMRKLLEVISSKLEERA